MEYEIADETSLLILDILVKLENGGMANIEVQKIGYKFAGERAAWHTFLSVDRPDRLIELLRNYPEYKQMYEYLYNMCRNN